MKINKSSKSHTFENYFFPINCCCFIIGKCQLECDQKLFLKLCSFVLLIKCLPHDYTPVLQVLDLKSLADKRVDNNYLFLSKLINSVEILKYYWIIVLGNINFVVPLRNHCHNHWITIPVCQTLYLKTVHCRYMMMKLRTHRSYFELLLFYFILCNINAL